jgi:hypothetical protein
MFGLKKDDYMLFVFADDKDFYTDEEDNYEGCDEFDILYLKNKEQLNDFDTNNNSWKQKIWENPKIHYNIKTINIKIKCKLVLEYEED